MKFVRYFFPVLFLIMTLQQVQAQDFCGAQAPDSVVALMDQLQPELANFSAQWIQQRQQSADNSVVQIPLKIHIVRESDGTGGLDPNEVDDIIAEVNSYYAAGGFVFFQCGDIAFVDNSTYYSFHESEEDALLAASYVENTINVYFVHDLTSLGGQALCGYAYFPFQNVDEDFTVVTYSCGAKTLAHELGHYFGVYHTHGTANLACSTDELVNGSNCDVAGDRVCDTPADPGLNANCNTVNNFCQYVGTGTDMNGQLYNPDVNNLMSYAPHGCREHFSQGQFARMAYYYQNYRTNLTCSNGGGGGGACTGQTTLTDCTGTISDGSGNNPYGNLLSCSWLIQPAGATSVTLTFSAFETEFEYDLVSVYDGTDANAPLLGTFSGNTLPPAMTANSGKMFITFTSDETVTGAGWAASYSCSNGGGGGGGACAGQTTLTDCTGTISDGSGNNPYGNLLSCSWLIQPAGATSVTLTFNAFETEFEYDLVSVYDGTDANAPLLGTFSGNTLPPAITANSGKMFITFTSDETVTGAGWAASYSCSNGGGGGGGVCTGQTTLTDCTGTISDGSGNNPYGNLLSCSWLIQPAGATSVTLTFSAFETEFEYDLVSVYDGTDANAPLLGTFSGNTLPPAITANSGKMFITFTSDETVTGAGWAASYSCSNGGGGGGVCTGQTTLTDCTGMISDGSGNNPYGNLLSCSWLIQPAGATSVTLTFNAFETENDYDIVVIYDGPDGSAPMLGIYSGNTLPPAITANSGKMFITFTSDESVNGAGWTASYSCSGGGGGGCTFTPHVTVNNCYLTAPNGANYQWYKNGDPIPGATEQSYAATANASYRVKMTDPNGCHGESQLVLVFCLTDASEVENETKLYVAPNPAQDQAVVHWENWPEETPELEVRAPDSRLVARWSVENSGTGQFTLPVANWPSGVYIVRLGSRTQRLIVQH